MRQTIRIGTFCGIEVGVNLERGCDPRSSSRGSSPSMSFPPTRGTLVGLTGLQA